MIYRRVFDFPTFRIRSPFDELERLRRQMDQLVDGISGGPLQRAQAGVFPLINLTEDKNNYYIRAELPGIKADELDIQAAAQNISISGERKISAEEGVKYHRREREAGKFSRVIGLPGEINADKVAAGLENGILTVAVPKAEAAKPRQIAVK
jgi:HSP20 family protein